MAQIVLKPDTLDPETERFAPLRLAHPLFMTSLQKSGTHLLRMFIPIDQQYRRAYIQGPTLKENLAAFDPSNPLFSFGHLSYSPGAAVRLADVRKLLLHRDPYDWVLARARFFSSDQFDDGLPAFKSGRMPIEDQLTLMVVGIPGKLPGVAAAYGSYAVPWLTSRSVNVVRYEDLAARSRDPSTDEAKAYFSGLFDAAGIEQPSDWADRVRVGADPARSGTSRQNLTGVSADFPDDLPEQHRRLVDYSAPGLRQLLGYA